MTNMGGTHDHDGYMKWFIGDGSTSGDSVCGFISIVTCHDAFKATTPNAPFSCSDTPASGYHFAMCGL